MLHREGERVRRELTDYAGLSQSAMHSMKVIADTLAQFKPEALCPAPRSRLSSAATSIASQKRDRSRKTPATDLRS